MASRARVLAALLPALALLAAAGGRARGADSSAPDVALEDAAGKTVRLSELRGRAVLLDFWATWCDSCERSLPFYESLSRRLSSGTFTMLGVDEGESAKTVAAFAKKKGLTYRLLLDRRRRAYDAFRIRGLPTAVLLDGEGRVVGRWAGFDAEISSAVARAAGSAAGSAASGRR